MSKKKLGAFGLLVLVVGICFATDFITLSAYESESSVSVDRQSASVLISRVNTLLTNIGASGVTITSAARPDGSETLHPKSRAIDLRFNQKLYDDIVANISGSGLRVECIDCIREEGQPIHIHLDIGGLNGEGLPLGRFFHIRHKHNIPYMGNLNINTYGNLQLKQFYGPPSYGETPLIDIIETYYILRLHMPIFVTHGNETATVQEIQLISNNKIRNNINTNRGYNISGQVFFGHTGHHHTPIILSVENIN